MEDLFEIEIPKKIWTRRITFKISQNLEENLGNFECTPKYKMSRNVAETRLSRTRNDAESWSRGTAMSRALF